MSAYRYAIYLAPPPDTALWRFGSQVLGYDAATRADLAGFAPPGFTPEAWRAATARPRRYGFHGTLKAPFRLAKGATEADLLAATHAEAARHLAFDAGPLAVTAIGQGGPGFVALTLQRQSERLAALEQSVVAGLDPFRAPLTDAEIAARDPASLSPRQRDNLARWGYPHVGADFTYHMTLSGALPNAAGLADALAECHATQVGTSHLLVDALVVFAQPEPDAPFVILARAPLGGSR